MHRKQIFERLAIAVTLLVAAMLRLHALDGQSFWRDESATRQMLHDPQLQLFAMQAPGENTPPVYFVFIKKWMQMFGTSDAVVRLPSAIFGIASVLMMYLFARRTPRNRSAGLLVGLFAALLLATSRYHIAYSQEARPYSMAFLLALISGYAFILLLQDQKVWPQWTYVLSTGLMFWTHPYTILFFFAQCVYLGFRVVTRSLGNRGIPLRRWLTLFGTVILCVSPWMNTASYLAHGGQAWMPKPDLNEVLDSYLGGAVSQILLGALAALAIIYAWRKKDSAPLFALLLAILPIAVPVLLSQGRHSLFVARYAIVALIGIYLLAALGAAFLGRLPGSVLVLACCCVGAPALIADYRAGLNSQIKPDLRGTVRHIQQMASPGDVVFCPWDWLELPLSDYLSRTRLTEVDEIPKAGSPDATRIHRIWLVLRKKTDRRDEALAGTAFLRNYPYAVKDMWFFTGIALYELDQKNPPATKP